MREEIKERERERDSVYVLNVTVNVAEERERWREKCREVASKTEESKVGEGG